MSTILGACGLVCSECEAYKATQTNDPDAIAKTAAEWSKMFSADIKPEYVWCDGCLAASSRKCGHCAECDIRACVTSHGLANCGECGDYACEKITQFFEMMPDAKAKLDQIKAARG
jgi:hypothetical protein